MIYTLKEILSGDANVSFLNIMTGHTRSFPHKGLLVNHIIIMYAIVCCSLLVSVAGTFWNHVKHTC